MTFTTEIDFANLVEDEDINGLAEALTMPNADFPNISKGIFVEIFNLAHKHQDADIVIGLLTNYALIVDRIVEQGEYAPVCHQLSLYQEASAKAPKPAALRSLINTMPIVPKALTYLIRVNSGDIDAYTTVAETTVLSDRDLQVEINEILYEFPENLLDPLFRTQNKTTCFEALNGFIEKMSPLTRRNKDSVVVFERLKNRREKWRAAVGMQAKSERLRMLNQSRKKLRRPKLG